MVWRTSASTAFRRWLMSGLEISGCSIQLRKMCIRDSIQTFVDLHRVGADDLAGKLLRQRNAQRGLAGGGGAYPVSYTHLVP